MKKLLVAFFFVGTLSGCGIFGDDGSDVNYEYEIYSEYLSQSEGANDDYTYGLFEEVDTSQDFLVQFQGQQDTLFTRGWRGDLGLDRNEEENYYIIKKVIE